MSKNKILDVMLVTQTKRQGWNWENMKIASNGESREIINIFKNPIKMNNSLERGFNKHEQIFVTW